MGKMKRLGIILAILLLWPALCAAGASGASKGGGKSNTGKSGKVAKAKSAVVKLLRMKGNPTKRFVAKPLPGRGSQGWEITVPGTDLQFVTFYTRTKGKDVWHIGMDVDMAKVDKALLTKVYGKLSDYLGQPRIERLILVSSEGDGVVKLRNLGTKLSKALEDFKDTDKLGRVRDEVTFKKGVNFFARIAPPTHGPLKTLERIVLGGGKISGGSLCVNGSLGYDIISRVLGDTQKNVPNNKKIKCEKPKKNPKMEGVSVLICFPAVTPLPFSMMDANRGKKLFYATLSNSNIMFSYDRKAREIVAGGKRVVSLWIVSKRFDITDTLRISRIKKGKKETFEVICSGELDLGSNRIKLLNDQFQIRKLFLAGKLRDMTKTGSSQGKNGKKSVMGFRVGAMTQIGQIKNLESFINIAVQRQKNKTRLKEVGFSITGDIGLRNIPLLKNVPAVRDFTFQEATVGIGLNKKGLPDVYLAGALKWKEISGEAAMLMKRVKGKPELLILSRVKDFSLAPFIDITPTLPGTEDMKRQAKEVFAGLRLPKGLFMISTAKSSKSSSEPLRLTDMPTRIQSMFDGLVAESEDVIPLYGDGVTIVGALDLTGINKIIKSDLVGNAIKQVGIGEEMKRMAVDGPLLVAGYLGGLRGGGLKAGVSIDLPYLVFPETPKPLSYVVQFDKGTAGFFTRVNLSSLSLQLGVNGTMYLDMPQIGDHKDTDHVKLAGELFVNLDAVGQGVRVAGYMNGKWRNPFGIGNIAVTDSAFLLGADTEGALEVGLGGGYEVHLPSTRLSPFPSPFSPHEDPRQLAASLKEHGIFAPDNPKRPLKPPRDIKAGMGVMLNVTLGARVPIPKKLGIYSQFSESSILTDLEVSDAIMKGVFTGPAADEFIKQSAKVMRATIGRERSNKAVKVMKYLKGEFGRTPSIVEIFHLRDLPFPLLEGKNEEFFFATPGAVLPGFDKLSSMGFRLKGSKNLLFLGTHHLGEADMALTMEDGLRFYVRQPNLDFNVKGAKLFRMHDCIIDLHAGIPQFHGDDVPYFRVAGDTRLLFFNGNGKLYLGKEGATLHMRSDFGAFGDVKIDLASLDQAGKPTKDILKTNDFKLYVDLSQDLGAGVRKEICNNLLGGLSGQINDARNEVKSCKKRVEDINKKIDSARKEALRTIFATEAKASEEAQKVIDDLKDQRGRLKRAQDKLSWGEKWKWPIYEAALRALDVQIALAQKTADAVGSAGKINIPTDANPLVAPLLLTRATAVAALYAADYNLRLLQYTVNSARREVERRVADVLDRNLVKIHKFELFVPRVRKRRFYLDMDLEIPGKKRVKKRAEIRGDSAAHAAQDAIARLAGQFGDLVLDKVFGAVRPTVQKGRPSFDPKAISLPPSFMPAPAKQWQKAAGTAKPMPIFHGSPRYYIALSTIRPNPKTHHGYWDYDYLTQTDPSHISSRDYPTVFELRILHQGMPHKLADGDTVVLLSPVNRYVTVVEKEMKALRTPRDAVNDDVASRRFTIEKVKKNSPTKDNIIHQGDHINLKSHLTRLYVSAYKGGGRGVKAEKRVPKGWENFRVAYLRRLQSAQVSPKYYCGRNYFRINYEIPASGKAKGKKLGASVPSGPPMPKKNRSLDFGGVIGTLR